MKTKKELVKKLVCAKRVISRETAKVIKLEKRLAEFDSVTYSIGDRFIRASFPQEYLLVTTAYGMAMMIAINDGSRWGDAKEVSRVFNITEEEFEKNWGAGKFIRCWDSIKQKEM